MHVEKGLAIVQTHFEAINWGNVEDALHLIDPSFVWHNHSTGQRFTAAAGYRAYLFGWQRAFPDFWLEVSRLTSGAHSVSCEFILRGTHNGTLTLPGSTFLATRRQIALPVCETYWVENGRLTAIHTYFDQITLLRQLGILAQDPSDHDPISSPTCPFLFEN